MFQFTKPLRRIGSAIRSIRSPGSSNRVGIRCMSTTLMDFDPSKVRNCAIIAHVDHGKTTMMDKLLNFCGQTFTGERAMDSNEHEKERGITITSKYTRLHYKDHILHVVDTPGHADFGGEVERILSMVDGVVLLVDATEGPMSQTKFVLSKALEAKKKAIVVLNKVDREGHRALEVENEILDLFCALTTNDAELDYPVLYASAKQGWVTTALTYSDRTNVAPLLDKIVDIFPPPSTREELDRPFALSVNTIQKDDHLGRIVTGKIETGFIALGDKIKGNFLLIYVCNFHVLNHFLLIYICKLHWKSSRARWKADWTRVQGHKPDTTEPEPVTT